jgi:ferredoxin-like protein FixX
MEAAAAELVTALREARICLAVAHGALKWHYPRGGFGVQFREG